MMCVKWLKITKLLSFVIIHVKIKFFLLFFEVLVNFPSDKGIYCSLGLKRVGYSPWRGQNQAVRRNSQRTGVNFPLYTHNPLLCLFYSFIIENDIKN